MRSGHPRRGRRPGGCRWHAGTKVKPDSPSRARERRSLLYEGEFLVGNARKGRVLKACPCDTKANGLPGAARGRPAGLDSVVKAESHTRRPSAPGSSLMSEARPASQPSFLSSSIDTGVPRMNYNTRYLSMFALHFSLILATNFHSPSTAPSDLIFRSEHLSKGSPSPINSTRLLSQVRLPL